MPGIPQVRDQFPQSQVLAYFVRKNVIADELAKLGFSWALVLTRVFW
jgi:hypothetical protein